MVLFQDYNRYIVPLLMDGYAVELFSRNNMEDIQVHDLAKYFDLIAVKQGIVRLIKIVGMPKAADMPGIKSAFPFDYPDIEVWVVRGETRKIYKIIHGDFYRLVDNADYFDCKDVKKVIRYELWGNKGIMVLGGYNAYFIPNSELFDNFERDIEPRLSGQVRVVYNSNKLTILRMEGD